MSTEGRVRAAEVADAPAIGRAHVRAWQAAYRGAMPDEFLDGLRAEDRQRRWERFLSSQPANEVTLVVEDAGGRVVGFAHIGRARDTDGGEGELYAINLDPDAWGAGLGRRLLEAATDELARFGFREAILWVVDSNLRARGFYEAAGWAEDGTTKRDEQFGPVITEVRYRRRLVAE